MGLAAVGHSLLSPYLPSTFSLLTLPRYLANPLTVNGHKFHLRVYVLCVGALRVYVNQDILMLLAAHKYTTDDLEDSLAHLSNTARGIEEEDFDEKKFVLVRGPSSSL
jgi:hypothetical protein